MKSRALVTLWISLSIAGCGGGGGSSADGGGSSGSGSSSPGNASAGGIWRGTDSASGLRVLGVIDEAGDLRLIRSDRTQYVSSAQIAGNTLSGSLETFSERGTTYADGSNHGTGSISGLVSARHSLELTVAYVTDNGTSVNSLVNLDYDPVYETPSSEAMVAGTYQAAATGTVFTVDTSGHFTAREAATGCAIDGTVSVVDADYNVYDLMFTFSSCDSAAAALDGVTATGLGTFESAGSAAQVEIAVSWTVAGQKVALVEELNRI